MSNNRTFNPWDLDIRVRERNVRAGLITEKDIEKHITTLVDQAAHTDIFTLPQPALDEPVVEAADEDDDEAEGDSEDGAA